MKLLQKPTLTVFISIYGDSEVAPKILRAKFIVDSLNST